MLNIAIRKKSIFAAFAFFVGLSFICFSISAQTYVHKVVRGDTLWSICEKYYGNNLLWPKLWQMNPFITNPHLLEPGDLINLLEDQPITTGAIPIIIESEQPKEISGVTETEEAAPQPVKPASVPVVSRGKGTGIDFSYFMDVKSLGYLTFTPVKPWGRIHTKNTNKILLAEGDLAFVQFYQTEGLKLGSEFVAFHVSPAKDPSTKKQKGQCVEILGTLILKKPLKKDYYLMQVAKLYRTINVDDLVMPVEPISPCILPLSANNELSGIVYTTKDEQQLIAERSIVYLNKGFNQGIQRGNIFHAVKNISSTKTKSNAKTDLLELSMGKIIIVESRPDTSVGLVFHMEADEFTFGAVVKSISWDNPPEFLENLMRCSVQ